MLVQNGGLMTAKPSRYFWITLLALLTACGQVPQTDEMTKTQNTAIAMAQTGVALTQIALPTATLPPSTFTPTALLTSTPPATPTPTPPIVPIITPDAIQVEKWKEYQTELAKALFSFSLPNQPEGRYNPEEYKDALCEWDILEWSGQEGYVWAACRATKFFDYSGMNIGVGVEMQPAVIYLEPDRSIQKVNIPSVEINRNNQFPIYDLHLFPINAQKKLCLYYFQGVVPQCGSIISDYVPNLDRQPRLEALFLHLRDREGHPGEPPLVVLSVMATESPMP